MKTIIFDRHFNTNFYYEPETGVMIKKLCTLPEIIDFLSNFKVDFILVHFYVEDEVVRSIKKLSSIITVQKVIIKKQKLVNFDNYDQFIIERIKELNNSFKLTEIKLIHNFNQVKVNGITYNLTETEFQILNLFYSFPNSLISKQNFEERLWGKEMAISSHTFGTHLTNLKNKVPLLKKHLVNIRGKGYIFKCDYC